MISAGTVDTVRMDTTTMLCVSNAYDNGFGQIDIVNLFNSIQADPPTSDKVNDATIVRCCDEADKTIIAFGKGKIQVDYCEFFQRDGSIFLDSEHMKNYVITFNGDNSAAIDNCKGITTISKIDSARAKSLLNIS